MEYLLIPIGIVLALVIPVGVIFGIIAFSRSFGLVQRMERMEKELRHLRLRVERLESEHAQPVARPVAVGGVAVPAPAPTPAPTPAPATGDRQPATGDQRPAAAPAPAPAPESAPVQPVPESTPAYAVPVLVAITPPSAPHIVMVEPRRQDAPSDAGIEKMVGQRWLTWAGVGVLFLAAVFFLKYAYDQGWLGELLSPPVRIALIAAAGVAAVITGLRLMGRGMAAIGQGLAGGGIALGYLAVYGAFSPDLGIVPVPLLSAGPAFALMAVVSAIGMGCAVRRDALAMAVLATLGGLMTPVLVSTHHGNRDLLAAYLLLLDLTVLGAAIWRSWRGLDLLAFAGTMILLGLASADLPHPHPDLPILPWLAAFHAVFLAAAFALHWRTRSVVPEERFALALANIALPLGWAASVLHADHAPVLGVVCLGLAGIYAGIGEAFRRRIPDDHRVGEGFAVLAATLIVLALFWLLPTDAIAAAWAVEACALAWIGHRFARPGLRHVALAILAVVLARCLAVHLPDPDSAAPLIFNRWLATIMVVPAGFAGLAWVHRRWNASGGEASLGRACAALATVLTLIFGACELGRHAHGHPGAWGDLSLATVIALWWLAGAAAALVWSVRRQPSAQAVAGFIALAGGTIAMLCPFVAGESVGSTMFLNLRFLVGALAIATLAWSARWGAALGWIAFATAVLLLSLEPAQWCDRNIADRAAAAVASHLAVTLAWTASASVLLAAGFLRRRRPWRFAALALFGLTAGKLLLIDMADARQLTRIASFAAVGVVLVFAAYAYHRLERRLGS